MSAPIQNGPFVDTEESLGIVKSDGSRAAIAGMHGGAANRELSASELVHFAIAQNLPVESLERIVALHEKMEARHAQKACAVALAAFQAEVRSIRHNKTAHITTTKGSKFSFTYASLDEMAEQINPVLAKHDLSYSWDTVVDEKGAMLTAICTVRHALGHSFSSSFMLPIANDSAMSPQQKVGAANHYARRQSLEAVLGLTTTDTNREQEGFDPTPITEDQRNEIEDLLIQATEGRSADKAKSIRARFFKYMECESVATIPAVKYQQAVAALTPQGAKP